MKLWDELILNERRSLGTLSIYIFFYGSPLEYIFLCEMDVNLWGAGSRVW